MSTVGPLDGARAGRGRAHVQRGGGDGSTPGFTRPQREPRSCPQRPRRSPAPPCPTPVKVQLGGKEAAALRTSLLGGILFRCTGRPVHLNKIPPSTPCLLSASLLPLW